MPSAYVVVWCAGPAGRSVLLAQKKFLGQRFGGAAIPVPQLLNSAGQQVFPGGAMNAGEAPQAAAYREFREETGIDLQAPGPIGNFNIVHNAILAGPGGGFHTLFVLVAAPADLALMAATINANILAGTPDDDELQSVAVVPEAGVAALLGPNPAIPAAGWHNPRMPQLAPAFNVNAHAVPAAGAFVVPGVRAAVTNKLTAPHGWYAAALGQLPGVAAAAAPVLAAAPPHGPPAIAAAGGGGAGAAPGGPAPVQPAHHVGWAIPMVAFLALLLALGGPVALNYLNNAYGGPNG